MNREKIERSARDLQIEIYRSRDLLWSDSDIPPLQLMFGAGVAAKVLGITFEVHPGLGAFGEGGKRFEVAGLIDRPSKKIAVSQRFTPIVQRFTSAHEVGHWQLHKSGLVLHRDRELGGMVADRAPRSHQEREADYFSACYLVPRNLAVDAFEQRFGPFADFQRNQAAAFGLRPGDPLSIVTSAEDSLVWELALATAIRYHNGSFESLAEFFAVSPMTMAIRLREIGLRQ